MASSSNEGEGVRDMYQANTSCPVRLCQNQTTFYQLKPLASGAPLRGSLENWYATVKYMMQEGEMLCRV